ncbi:MAG: hypothetical protein HZA46_14190 [Planctomycetales bacterium]|nr:hypothetical protein [Planctomycetales bacterium]
MKRTVVGIVIAQVVLYFFGFIWWGLGPYPSLIWKQARSDDAAAQALREQFPENGTYLVPSTAGKPEDVDHAMRRGPVAFVHMLRVEGRAAMEPSIMVTGFATNLIVIVLIALLLGRCSTALPTYADRVKFVAFAGFIAAFFIDGGEIVWWQMPANWKLYQAGYDFLFWVIAGLILAKFVGPQAGKSSAV